MTVEMNKAQTMHMIATLSRKKKERDKVRDVYDTIIERITFNAKLGYQSYRYFIRREREMFNILSAEDFELYQNAILDLKKKYPIVKEMLEEEGFVVKTNLFKGPNFDPEYYIEVEW